jgi:hypothetical protein
MSSANEWMRIYCPITAAITEAARTIQTKPIDLTRGLPVHGMFPHSTWHHSARERLNHEGREEHEDEAIKGRIA